jgi:hypothetical protein
MGGMEIMVDSMTRRDAETPPSREWQQITDAVQQRNKGSDPRNEDAKAGNTRDDSR